MATTLTASNQKFEPRSWESVPCPLCGEDRPKLLERFGYEHRYSYQSCGGCGLAYQTPRP